MLEIYCLARRTRVPGCSWCAQLVGSCDVSALGLGDTKDAVANLLTHTTEPVLFPLPCPYAGSAVTRSLLWCLPSL